MNYGLQVGYSVDFDDGTSDTTILKYMTDGRLLLEIMRVPDLASFRLVARFLQFIYFLDQCMYVPLDLLI